MQTKLIRRMKRAVQRFRHSVFGMENRYKALSTPEIFDRIYTEGAWGHDDHGRPTSGAGSHNEEIVQAYFSAVSALLTQHAHNTVVDIGCGDFEVGCRFLPFARRYIACDVSEVILQQNRSKFSASNLEFQRLNLATDDLPSGDVALVRQVLQHLSNREIQAFVNRLHQARPYRYLVVTEHLPADRDHIPNLDKRSGPRIRLSIDSGVTLDAPPFCLAFVTKEILLEVPFDIEDRSAIIRTTAYQLHQ